MHHVPCICITVLQLVLAHSYFKQPGIISAGIVQCASWFILHQSQFQKGAEPTLTASTLFC